MNKKTSILFEQFLIQFIINYLLIIIFQSFGRAERLEEHLRTHTGETPYKCDICSKGFTTKHNLLRHRNIHTLERKYTCKYCHKFFADPTQHKRHQATHFAKQNKGQNCGDYRGCSKVLQVRAIRSLFFRVEKRVCIRSLIFYFLSLFFFFQQKQREKKKVP